MCEQVEFNVNMWQDIIIPLVLFDKSRDCPLSHFQSPTKETPAEIELEHGEILYISDAHLFNR